jgi:hypothetical protein
MKIFDKLTCWATGHKRGKRLTETTVTFSDPNIVQYECPRCHATWTRKCKVKA